MPTDRIAGHAISVTCRPERYQTIPDRYPTIPDDGPQVCQLPGKIILKLSPEPMMGPGKRYFKVTHQLHYHLPANLIIGAQSATFIGKVTAQLSTSVKTLVIRFQMAGILRVNSYCSAAS